MANIIFDFDGTIADSFDYVFSFLSSQADKRNAVNRRNADDFRRMSMRDIALKVGIKWWRLPFVYFKGRREMRAHLMKLKAFDGMGDVIRTLYEQGNELSIISANSAKNIRRFLRANELDQYFKTVKGGAGILGKVTPIKRLAKNYPDSTWYIGDEVADVVSAKAARVRSLAVLWGFSNEERLKQYEPDAFARKARDILDVLGK